MATMTAEALALRALELLGVKAADQPASAEDTVLAQEQVTSAFAEYRHLGLCPFDSATIPEWAQDGMIQIVAAKCSPFFGQGQAPQMEALGRERLAAQVAHSRRGEPIVAIYF